MFAYIKGRVAQKEMASHGAHRLVLECHGFGMEMQVSQQTFSVLPEIDEEAQIYTIFVVKETEAILFGFAEAQEKELFLLLTSVSGIGPKHALALLSTFKPEQLCEAIIHENGGVISQAPGVGAKVAGRIILELKTKIEGWQEKSLLAKRYAQGGGAQHYSAIDEEARTILAGLGYSPSEIMHTLAVIKKQHEGKDLSHDVEGLVKESLKALGAGSVAHKLS
jgi:holliday junction DNA helicase RuvA